jgi:hypothetical protein
MVPTGFAEVMSKPKKYALKDTEPWKFKKPKLTGLRIIRYGLALSLEKIRPSLDEFGRQAEALVKRSKEYEKAKAK